MLDERANRVPRRGGHLDPFHGRLGGAERLGDVAGAAAHLAQVVEQQREGEQRRLVDLGEQLGERSRRGIVRRAQAPQAFDRPQGVLVHGVAVVEVADDQALDPSPLREHGLQHAGLMHSPQGEGRVRKRQHRAQRRPERTRRGRELRQPGQGGGHVPLGFRRQAHAVPGDVLEQAQYQRRIVRKLVRNAEEHLFAGDRELGVGQPRPPVLELRQQRAGVALDRLQFPDRGAVNAAGVVVVAAHELSRVGGGLLLQIEGEQVVVAAGAGVEPRAQPEQKGAGRLQFRRQIEARQPVRRGRAELAQPAHQLEVAQAAGRLLDVRLQLVDGFAVPRMAGADQPAQMKGQPLALAVQEAAQLQDELRVQTAVAGQEALVQQADAELDVALVQLAALGGRAHRVAHPQARVPELLQEGGNAPALALGQHRPLHQQQQIDVGVGKQLLTPEPADGHQRQSFGEGRLEEPLESPVDGGLHQGTAGLERSQGAGRGRKIIVPCPRGRHCEYEWPR